MPSLVGSEMCIRDSLEPASAIAFTALRSFRLTWAEVPDSSRAVLSTFCGKRDKVPLHTTLHETRQEAVTRDMLPLHQARRDGVTRDNSVYAANLVGLGFLRSVSYIKSTPTHQKIFCCGKKWPQMPFLTYIVSWVGLALGWGVRQFHHSVYMFFKNTLIQDAVT